MKAFLNLTLEFITEVDKLSQYPELLNSDIMQLRLLNSDFAFDSPLRNTSYDARLFHGLANHFRKLLILKREPINIEAIHRELELKVSEDVYSSLSQVYKKIQELLDEKAAEKTQFQISLPGSILDNLTVRELINDFFAAILQHSKPDLQRKIFEINTLFFGNLSEIIRVLLFDLQVLLSEYVQILKGPANNR